MQPGERQIFGTSRFGQTLSSETPKIPNPMGGRADDVATSIESKAKQMAATISDKAHELGDDVREKAEAGLAFVQQHGKSFLDESTSVIRRNAIPALLISFGLGVLLAQAFEKRR